MERLQALLPPEDETGEALLLAVLEEARELVLAETNRTKMLPVLVGPQVQMALVLLNRQGIEGEVSHDEGGVHRQMEALPEGIKRVLARHVRTKDVMRCDLESGTSGM